MLTVTLCKSVRIFLEHWYIHHVLLYLISLFYFVVTVYEV